MKNFSPWGWGWRRKSPRKRFRDGDEILSPAETVEIHGDEDGRRILPEAGNENGDGEHFRWWGKE
ncbi:hypothetical protein A2U01_0037068, partial [Trifolium medium]|nr:hypothetical protein [Trifolium medium]